VPGNACAGQGPERNAAATGRNTGAFEETFMGAIDGEEACEHHAVVTVEQQRGTEPEASKN
jgi:hypothetical protein